MAADSLKGLRPETLAVAFGYDPAEALGAVKPPVYLTSTFIYPSAQHAKDVHEAFFDGTGPLAGKKGEGHIYSRLGHPGLDILEARLAAIDGAEAAAAFSSGMAAHSSIALTFVKPGDSVLHGRPIYGGVDMLYGSVMPGFGTHVETYTDGCDPDHVRAAARAALAKGPQFSPIPSCFSSKPRPIRPPPSSISISWSRSRTRSAARPVAARWWWSTTPCSVPSRSARSSRASIST